MNLPTLLKKKQELLEKRRKILDNLLIKRAREDFFIFAKFYSLQNDPNANMDFLTYKMSCEVLQAFIENRLFIKQEGGFKRVDFVFFNACPSWGKSYLITRLLNCWLFATRKLEQFTISANEHNRKKIMTDISLILNDAFYKNIFKEFSLKKNNDSEKVNHLNGWLNMNPARSDITGSRGEFFIFDDFDKPTHVSRAEHETSKEFLNMYLTRGYKNRITRNIVVAQRVAIDDATGYIMDILEKGNMPFVRINIPYKFEVETKYQFYIQDKNTNEIKLKEWVFAENTFSSCDFTQEKYDGEVLFKECQGNKLKRETQYQGVPSVSEGAFITPDDLIQRYNENQDALLSKKFFDRVWISMDTASKTGKNNDYSAFVCIGEKQGFYYILDVLRQKKTSPVLFNEISDFYFKWAKYVRPYLLIEDKSSGEGLIQRINSEGLTCRLTNVKTHPALIPYPISISKQDKLLSVLQLFKSKKVLLPQSASWLLDYEKELITFPNSKHDDQLDATTNCLKYIQDSPILTSKMVYT